MNDNNETRTAQHALALPEVVSIILEFIYFDSRFWNPWECGWQVLDQGLPLLDCGLVNWVWFHQAMRYLWKSPICRDLPKLLEKVTPQRRQFYANFVEQALMCVIKDHSISHYDAMLRGIRFPRLTCLCLHMMIENKESQNWECHIPRLESHGIKTLIFDYCCVGKAGLTPDEMDQVLDQIPTAFPQVEEIRFDNEPQFNNGALERLTQRLPGLKRTDHFIRLNTD